MNATNQALMNNVAQVTERTQTARNATDTRALALLGSGLNAASVSMALGVSESYISQLMSQEGFKEEVTALRYEALNKHNARDVAYDSIEDKLIKQLSDNLPLMQRPMEILRAITVINGAKRRGQSAPEQLVNSTQVVNLLMPVSITQKFTTNVNNQVMRAGEQTLETIQSGTLLRAAKQRVESLHHEQPSHTDVQSREITDNRSESMPDPRQAIIQERVRELTTRREPTTESTNNISVDDL